MEKFDLILLLIAVMAFLIDIWAHVKAGKLRQGNVYPAKVLLYMSLALLVTFIGEACAALLALDMTADLPSNQRMLWGCGVIFAFPLPPILAWYLAQRRKQTPEKPPKARAPIPLSSQHPAFKKQDVSFILLILKSCYFL